MLTTVEWLSPAKCTAQSQSIPACKGRSNYQKCYRGDIDMVVDFSSVDIVTSSSLSKLLKLRKLTGDCGHRLVFCSVAPATKGIFTVTGLDGVFELADDKFVALASLQMVGSE